jgi:GT2 family glycosyltransferase
MVRAEGCAAAVHRAGARGVAAQDIWLAVTDADSVVPPNWLTAALALADAETADLVVGTVLPGPELTPVARDAWLAVHDLRDGHRHVHGANLGVRASSLDALGGWAPLSTGEDVDLVRRADLAAMTVVRTGAIAVHTSARLQSRITLGFAGYLRDMDDASVVNVGTEVTGAA